MKTVIENVGVTSGLVRYNMGKIAGVLSENPTNDNLVTSQFIESNQASSFGLENRGPHGHA